MRRRAIAGLGALLAALSVPTPVAGAQSALDRTARLHGHYELTGRVTVARHILGEQVGQTVLRTWVFTPLCAAGPCRSVGLVRQRQAGSDHLVLHLVAANRYAGSGRFFVPLRCGRRIYSRGESVPFTVTVRITAASIVNEIPVATRVSATYTNRRRTNLTPCVAVPGHDAATYRGGLLL